MRKIKSITKIIVFSFTATLLWSSCADEEKIFSSVLTSEFGKTDAELAAVVAAAYSSYTGHIGQYWVTSEASSDEVVVPTRGTDWAERGQWRRLHDHDFQPDDFYADGAWVNLYGGINTFNRIIFQLEGVGGEGPEQIIKELRALRALNYYMLLDLYGNVPLVTSFDDAEEEPANASRAEVFAFVRDELVEILPDLPEDLSGNYGQVTRWMGEALLTKLYLNAEVYNGTAQWDKVIEHADNIINSGLFNLESDFFANFSQDNESSSENIFVIVYDPVFSGGMQIGVRTLHYGHQAGWEFANQPWNGFASLSEFYDKFDQTDPRIESFVAGPQFGFDGREVIDDTPGAGDDTPQVIFSTSIRALDDARREDGVRIGKFELFVRGSDPGNGNNDFPIFRLGDIILSKAEAHMRLGQNADALMLVNMIRERVGMPDLTTLTLDELLDERAREVAFEGYRRQDLIRFGKFQDAWEFKPAGTSDHTNIFPISDTQLNANPNLQQNPGYPGRGGG